jgi:hypothetical protein
MSALGVFDFEPPSGTLISESLNNNPGLNELKYSVSCLKRVKLGKSSRSGLYFPFAKKK